MTKQETAQVLMILTGAFSRPQADDATISIWAQLLSSEHKDDVMAAIMYIIENDMTNGFMPTVPQLKTTIRKLWGKKTIDPAKIMYEIEIAARNSTYNYMTEYERLSEPAKQIVGSPSSLQEYARMSHNQMVEDVRKGIKLYQETEVVGNVPDRVTSYLEARKDNLLNG